jgi:uroporphyrin-III C-methyltransferase/precorrin-2 dehydrogenase/sirohydrochlorin ferrochelatase
VAAHADWRGAWPSVADLTGAALVFAANGDEDKDREIWSLAHEAGVPVNIVDRPGLCDFYTPSIVNRAPLAVAVAACVAVLSSCPGPHQALPPAFRTFRTR